MVDIGAVLVFLACIFVICLEVIFDYKSSKKNK